MSIHRLPRVRLAHLPTPIEALPRLSAKLGGPQIWVKRDDQTGLAFGGNKTRKLEYLLAEAQPGGAKMLITRGARQSNHCRQTAAAAARTGLRCRLVLSGEPPESSTANVLLDRLLGAELIWTQDRDPDTVLQAAFDEAWKEGERPFLIPYGGSSPTGAAAYAQAIAELLEQGGEFDRIVFASSSGGTQAGMLAGARLHGFEGRITGISVDKTASAMAPAIAALATQITEKLGEPSAFEPEQVDFRDGYLGGGYAVMGELEREAILLFAREEGILLDPVYTGRAAAGMIDLIRKGEIQPGERVLFWHTGGTPALFAYADELP